jgi:hypothetical protein
MILFGIRKDQNVRYKDGTALALPCILPAYRAQYEEWQKLPIGKILKNVVTQERELNHHNQFFALCAFTFENLPEDYPIKPTQFEIFRKWVLCEIGYCEIIVSNDVIHKIPYSLGFEHVDEITFMSKVWWPGIDYCGKVLGMSREEIMAASQEWRENKKLYSGGRNHEKADN